MTGGHTAKISPSGGGSGFDIALRGYDRKQVDQRLARAATERQTAAQRIGGLEHRVEELQVELQNTPTVGAEAAPSYAGLGARVEKILRLAEEEATELLSEALGQAENTRGAAETAGACAGRAGRSRPSRADPAGDHGAARPGARGGHAGAGRGGHRGSRHP